MSPTTTFTGRKSEVPCRDGDLYAFLTDLRNVNSLVPQGMISDWEAERERCSFRAEGAGRVTVTIDELMPWSLITYQAESLFTGKVKLMVNIEHISDSASAVTITATVNMNPLMKMVIGNSAERYLDMLMDHIESYDGYETIRGCSGSA